MNRLRLTLVALALLAASGAGAQEPYVVKVGILMSTTDTPLFIADKKGYFREEGLTVDFIPFDSGAGMTVPLGSGQLDVGGGALSVGLYNAVQRGIDVRVVADLGSDPPGYGLCPFMVRSDLIKSGRYKSLKDLKGLTVAGNSPQSSGAAILDRLLKRAHLTPNDIKTVYLSYPDQIAAFKTGQIEAAVSLEPFASESIKNGTAVRVMGDDEFYPNQEISVIMYGGNFIKNHRDLGLKFMRAYLRGTRYYNDALAGGHLAGPNSDEVIKILLDTLPIKDPSVFKLVTSSGDNPNGHAYLDSMRSDLAFFKGQGAVKGDIQADQIVDDSFVTEVVKQLGPYKPHK